jgi:hypothetical protein
VKRILVTLALILSFIAPLAGQRTPAAINPPPRVQSSGRAMAKSLAALSAADIPSRVLPNGLEVIVLEDH